jgi:hypothetical protein
LDMRFFVHREHHRVVRRMQIQADDIGSLGLRRAAPALILPGASFTVTSPIIFR